MLKNHFSKVSMLLAVLLLTALTLKNDIVIAENQPDPLSIPTQKPIAPQTMEAVIDNYVAENMEAMHVPGLEIAVVQGAEVVLAKGYGFADLTNQIPMTSHTAVRAGSVSKPATALVVLQLAAQGLIDLDAPVSAYITDLDLEDNYGQASTVAQLLVHEGGYDDTFMLSHAATYEAWQPLGEVLAADLPPRAIAPGKVMAYSDWGYSLLGYLIEQVTGMPYEAAIDQFLFTPLGMQDSTYVQPLPAAIAEKLAKGYFYSGGEYHVVPHDFVRLSPGIALITTAEDMGRYMLALLNNGLFNGKHILDADMMPLILERQATAHPYSRGSSYALTETTLNGRNVLYKDGNGIGFANRMILVPEHSLGIFMTVNHRNLDRALTLTDAAQFIRKLGNTILETFVPESEIAPPAVSPLPDAAERAGRYVGHYHRAEAPRNDFFKIAFLIDYADVTNNGDGTITIGANNTYVEVEPLVFQNVDYPNSFVIFVENDQGEIEFLTFGGTGSYQKAKWYETKTIQFGLIGFMGLIFLSMVIIWPFSRQGHWLALGVSLLALAFFIGFGLLFALSDFIIWYKTVPLSTKIVFTMPWISAILALALPIFVAAIWRDNKAALWGKIHYSLVSLSAFLFIWFSYFWNFFLY